MTDNGLRPTSHGWTHAETDRRQLQAGLRMTPSERLAWLEEMLDELLPFVGRAREIAPPRKETRGRSQRPLAKRQRS